MVISGKVRLEERQTGKADPKNLKPLTAMARQDTITPLTGSVGNLIFYKTQDGYLARKKGGISKERIRTEAAFARTRENNAEFRRCGSAIKLLRSAFSLLLQGTADNRVASRLTKALMQVIVSDAINPKGERNVTDGNIKLLEGFDFNVHGKLAQIFHAPYTATIDPGTGTMTIDIPAFLTQKMIVAPQGATHFRFKSAGASIDFKGNTFETKTAETGLFPLEDEVREPIRMTLAVAPSGVPLLLVLGVEFVQVINGVPHSLQDVRSNGLAVVKVVNG